MNIAINTQEEDKLLLKRKKKAEYNKIWQENNKEKHKEYQTAYHRTRNYGISHEDYLFMYMLQKGVCAICYKRESVVNRSGEIRPLAVDHNHDTGKIRGLLCNRCNTGIGNFKEDMVVMKSAIKYLENKSV